MQNESIQKQISTNPTDFYISYFGLRYKSDQLNLI